MFGDRTTVDGGVGFAKAGVSPAQQVSFSGRANRPMSPISAIKIAAKVGPTPLVYWITRYPRFPASRLAIIRRKSSGSLS